MPASISRLHTNDSNDRSDKSRSELKEKDRYKFVLEEARTVLPGLQALFGFQLMTVFNPKFKEMILFDQHAYWVALLLILLAMGLLMTPAAYDRQTKCHRDPKHFEKVATVLITCALLPFLTALSIDAYIVTREMFQSEQLATLTGSVMFVMFGVLWYGFPLYMNATHKFEKHKSH